jgi:hypothetical protein
MFWVGWRVKKKLLTGKQSKACIMYYDFPEEKISKINTLNTPILFYLA